MRLRIGISVQSKQIDLDARFVSVGFAICKLALAIESQCWAIGVLVCVQEYVRPIVFVVAGYGQNLGCDSLQTATYSLAHLYGSNAKILGRAQVCSSKPPLCLEAAIEFCCEGLTHAYKIRSLMYDVSGRAR